MKLIYLAILSILSVSTLVAQSGYRIRINEFLANNVTTNVDMVDFDDFSDWIELYNAEAFDVDIMGYFITDNLNDPYRWQFTESTVIPARGFLIVWADGFNYNPGKHPTRPYLDQNNERIYFETQYHHTNFNLSRAGETIGLFDPEGNLVDGVSFKLQHRDVSRGRQPDGSNNWFYFGEPTPASANTTEGVTTIQYTDTPVISLTSGFYTGTQMVSVTAGSNITIRYTLDGSKPVSSSTLYTGPITISHTTVLKVRCFASGKLPSPVIARTYLIDENTSLPVISLATSPEWLWGDKLGIYKNTYREREIPVHCDFFEADGTLGFSVNAGIRLTGQLSVFYPQKSLTLEARERYGTDAIDYHVFPERDLNTFKALYLRTAGFPDNRDTFFRDALQHELVINKIDLDCQAYRPAVLFLNGEYWGIYNIRDKINDDYAGYLFNLNPDEIDMLEYEATRRPTVMHGDDENYDALYDYITDNDLSVPDYYHVIESWMDLDEYINYQICEIFSDNVFWPDQNIRMWRERRWDAKWRWILFDLEFGFGMPNARSTDGYRHNTLAFATAQDWVTPPPWSTLIFRKLLANEQFKIKFIQRFAVYLNSIFHPDTVLTTINRLQTNLEPEMQRHIARWRNSESSFVLGNPIPDYSTWLQNVLVMKTFAANRPRYQREHLIDYFDLAGTTVLNLNIMDPGKGRIKTNDVILSSSNSSGIYFQGIPTILQAIPEVGYRFARWQGVTDSLQNPIMINTSADSILITARFEPIAINILPAMISADTRLEKSHSPYYAASTINVSAEAKLQMEAGVSILMPEKASIVIQGTLLIEGSKENPVIVKPNEYAQRWGGLCLVNASDTSHIAYLNLTGATKGIDFSRDRAAISAYNSNIILDNVVIENCQAPFFAQYGCITIKNCRFFSRSAGDLINIKQAKSALVENCDLQGNDQFDSDGIDYDQLPSGIIRGNRIYNFYGFNSDAIDLGEGSQNIVITNNIIYNIDDKGVSIGTGSTAEIKRNLIVGCGQGVGIKDYNSYGYLEHNTFYANRIGIACFVKNTGRGGGTANAVNCLIANSIEQAVYVDELSHLAIEYCLSNTDVLPGVHNIHVEPLFLNNLYPAAASPVINAGNPGLPVDPDGSLPDIGAYPYEPEKVSLTINEIHYYPLEGDNNQFIEIVNTGTAAVATNQFKLSGSIQYSFANDVVLQPGHYLVVAKNKALYQGNSYEVCQWDNGQLPHGTGTILLYDVQGNLLDFVTYGTKIGWPDLTDGQGPSLELYQVSLENMAASSWRSSYAAGGTPGKSSSSVLLKGIVINEFLTDNETVNSDETGDYDDWIELYNSTESPANIGGLYLTDNLDLPRKFRIAHADSRLTTIPPKGYLLFWADGQTDQGIMHLNFKLDRTGEQLGLIQLSDDDTIFIDSLSFGRQSADVSYGRYYDGASEWDYFTTPTPLSSNQLMTDIREDQPLPDMYFLSQNYPNPFNPVTTIKYQLPMASEVQIAIYNILGQKVATLVSGRQKPGYYKITWDGRGFASGLYFYRITTPNFVRTMKMVLIK